MLEITSLQNPTFKFLTHLSEKKERDRSKMFLIEGYRECLRAYEGKTQAKTLFICPELFLGDNEDALIDDFAAENVEIVRLKKNLFEKLSFRDRPDGLILLAHQTPLSLVQLESIIKQSKAPFLLIAESIEKPGNLGSILRSCDATHVDAVIVCDRCTDVYNPNVIRSSVGTLFTVPVFELSSQETLHLLKREKIQVVAGTPHTDMIYTNADFTQGVAIAVGTEQLGLSDLWMDACDIKVKIPMLGKADSLNVANATTLLLYEVVRQRS